MRPNPSAIDWLRPLLLRYQGAIESAGQPFIETMSAHLLQQTQRFADHLHRALAPYGIEPNNEAVVGLLIRSMLVDPNDEDDELVTASSNRVRRALPSYYAVFERDAAAAELFDRHIASLNEQVVRSLQRYKEEATRAMFSRMDENVIYSLHDRAVGQDPEASYEVIEDALFDAFWEHLQNALNRELDTTADAMFQEAIGDVPDPTVSDWEEERAEAYEDYVRRAAWAVSDVVEEEA